MPHRRTERQAWKKELNELNELPDQKQPTSTSSKPRQWGTRSGARTHDGGFGGISCASRSFEKRLREG